MDSQNTGGAPPDERPAEQRETRPTSIVRYGAMAWIGEFQHRGRLALKRDDKVVVQSDRGIELGQLAGPWICNGCACPTQEQVQTYVKQSGPELCRPRAGKILRLASDQDINEHDHLNAHVKEDVDLCAEIASQLDLDLRVVTAEHLLGGERIVFYFTSPERVDFRQLVKELAQRFRTRIEMRQVRPRDEARLVADYEICGRECCCKNFLKRLRPVGMKMAKLQKSTLDPSKVSGRCGLLRCCLRYEHDGYEELEKRLPRNGTRVLTEAGPATVLDRQVLTQLLLVRTEDDRVLSFPMDEILETNLPPGAPKPPPKPPARPAAERRDKPETEDQPGDATDTAQPARRKRSRRRRGRKPREDAPPRDASDQAPSDESRFQADPPIAEDKPTGDDPPSGNKSAADDDGRPRKSRRRRRRRRPGKGGKDNPGDGGGDQAE